MIILSGQVRYFMYRSSCDMRCGVDSLSGKIRNELAIDPLSGDIFIFISSNRRIVKLLQWEGDGFGLYSKRLESGTYEIPKQSDGYLGYSVLLMLLQGVSLKDAKYRKRYVHCVEK
jgi:transposase